MAVRTEELQPDIEESTPHLSIVYSSSSEGFRQNDNPLSNLGERILFVPGMPPSLTRPDIPTRLVTEVLVRSELLEEDTAREAVQHNRRLFALPPLKRVESAPQAARNPHVRPRNLEEEQLLHLQRVRDDLSELVHKSQDGSVDNRTYSDMPGVEKSEAATPQWQDPEVTAAKIQHAQLHGQGDTSSYGKQPHELSWDGKAS